MITVITGGAGALGSAVATHLVSQGNRVALLDVPGQKDRLDALARQLGIGKAIGLTGDFAEAGAWKEALATIQSAFGGAPSHAALIAGGWDGGAQVFEEKEASIYTRMMRMNADTVHTALNQLLPAMVSAKAGSIVVIGSRAIERPWTGGGAAAYAASKAAVVTLAQVAAAEVLEHGVRINAVLPSTLDTPANRKAMPDADASKWVSLDAAAKTIGFLLSDDARDVSGAALPLYGRA